MAGLSSEQLNEMSPDQLYARLGEIHLAKRNTLLNTLLLTQDFALTGQDTTSIGQLFFNNLNRNAYNFFCVNNTSADSLFHLTAALGIKTNTEMINAVASVLATYLGWDVMVATIVAVLLIKVVFPAVGATLCERWKQGIDTA